MTQLPTPRVLCAAAAVEPHPHGSQLCRFAERGRNRRRRLTSLEGPSTLRPRHRRFSSGPSEGELRGRHQTGSIVRPRRVRLRPIRCRSHQADVMARRSFRTHHVEDVRRARHAAPASRPHRQQRRAPERGVARHRRQREQPGASDIVSATRARSVSRPARFRRNRPRSRVSIRRWRAGPCRRAVERCTRQARSMCANRQSAGWMSRSLAPATAIQRIGRFQASTRTLPMRAHRPDRTGGGRGSGQSSWRPADSLPRR